MYETSRFNNPAPGSILSSKVFNPDYWWAKMVALFELIFRTQNGNLLRTLATLFSIFFISLMAYCIVRLFEIRRKEHHHMHEEIKEFAQHQKEKAKRLEEQKPASHNPAWSRIVNDLYSGTESAWKLAIMEADTMLDNLMKELGFPGETLGERLKAANQDTFRNLSLAWEAHAVRNRIAHEAGYDINLNEAKRVLALYEQVFHAYGYI
jgi:hypothetical protein